jgi:hypothetical protein|tara:strand:+ start:166 stop:456 length:291 start_codon:yes stop_codon:yes gene_type:complete
MKITIDTKEDSHEELRKVIKMLSSLVGQEVMSNNGDIFNSGEDTSNQDDSQEATQSGNDMFNMFSGNSETKAEDTTENKEEEKEEVDLGIPKVEEY